MNDLNSIFMVGRVKNPGMVDGQLTFTLVNNYNAFDEDSKESKKEEGIYKVVMAGKSSEKLWEHCLEGTRLAVNGRLKCTKDGVVIVTYTIQFLDSKKKGE